MKYQNIDIRDFANINNDHELSGNMYQGAYADDIARYVISFIKRLQQPDCEFPKLRAQDRALYLEALTSYIPRLNASIASYNRNALFNQIDTIALAVKLLKQNYLLLHGGWSGNLFGAGHFIAIELKFVSNGLLVILHNDGSGTQYHQKIHTIDGEFYASAKVFLIPLDLKNDIIKAEYLIRELTLPLRDSCCGSEPYYKHIQAVMHFFDAEEQDPRPYCKKFSKGQRSGTCTWKSLSAYLQNTFIENTAITYDIFKIELKFMSILDLYFTYSNKTDTPSQSFRQHFNFAIENLARMLLKQANEIIELPLERIEYMHSTIQGMLKAINLSNPPPTKIEYVAKQITAVKAAPRYYVGLDFNLNASDIVSSTIPDKPLQINLLHFNSEISGKLQWLIDEFALASNERNYLVWQVETFILNIPVHYWQQLCNTSQNHKCKIIQQLIELNFLYTYYYMLPKLPVSVESRLVRYIFSVLSITLITSILDMSLNYVRAEMGTYINVTYQLYQAALSQRNRQLQLEYSLHLTRLQHIYAFEGAADCNSRMMFTFYCMGLPSEVRLALRSIDNSFELQDSDMLVPGNNTFDTLVLFQNARDAAVATHISNTDNNFAAAMAKGFASCTDWLCNRTPYFSFLSLFTKGQNGTEKSMYENSSQVAYESSISAAQSNLNALCMGNDFVIPISLPENGTTTPEPQSHKPNISNEAKINNKYINKLYLLRHSKNHDDNLLHMCIALASMRCNDSTVVTSVYDFLSLHHSKLTLAPIQEALQSRLIFSNAITWQLKNHPYALLQLTTLLQKLFQHYNDDSGMRPQLLFIIRICLLIQRHLLSINSDPIFTEEAMAAKEHLLQQTNIITNEIPNMISKLKSNTILTPIQHDRILILNLYNIFRIWNDYSYYGAISIYNVVELLTANCRRSENNPNNVSLIYRDHLLEYYCGQAMFEMAHTLKQLFNDYNKDGILNRVFSEISPDPATQNLVWHGRFPFFYSSDANGKYQINLYAGIAYIEHKQNTLQPLPPNIFNDDTFKFLFNKVSLKGLLSPNHKFAEFSFGQRLYRYVNGNIHIQLIVNNTPSWFVILKNDSSYHSVLPHTMIDANHIICIWSTQFKIFSNCANPSNEDIYTVIIDSTTHEPKYIMQAGKVLALNMSDNTTYSVLQNFVDQRAFFIITKSSIYQCLTRFEHHAFIELWAVVDKKSQATIRYRLMLPRYGFEFEFSAHDQTQLIWSKDKRYKLDLTSQEIIAGFDNFLMLVPLAEYSDLPRKVLIPIQDFILSRLCSISSHKHHSEAGFEILRLDTANEARTRLKVSSWGLNGQRNNSTNEKYFDTRVRNAVINEYQETYSKDFRQQEQYSCMNIDPQDKIIVTSAQDILHLATIYFACNQAEKAFSLLQQCQPLLSGTASELSRIAKIISGPYSKVAISSKEKNLENAAYRMGAVYIATRMKALALLAHAMNKHPSDNNNESIKNKNSVTLYFTIAQTYYNTNNNVPDTMRLTSIDEFYILQFINECASKYSLELPPELTARYKQEAYRICVYFSNAIRDLLSHQNTALLLRKANYTSLMQEIANFDLKVVTKHTAIEKEEFIVVPKEFERHTWPIKPKCLVTWEPMYSFMLSDYYNLEINLLARKIHDFVNLWWLLSKNNPTLIDNLNTNIKRVMKIISDPMAEHLSANIAKDLAIALHYALIERKVASLTLKSKRDHFDPIYDDKELGKQIKDLLESSQTPLTRLYIQATVERQGTTLIPNTVSIPEAFPISRSNLGLNTTYADIRACIFEVLHEIGIKEFILESYSLPKQTVATANLCVFDTIGDNEACIANMIHQVKVEYEKGLNVNQSKLFQNALSERYLNSHTVIEQLSARINEQLEWSNEQLEYLTTRIDFYANKFNLDCTKKLQHLGKHRHLATLHELMHIFLKQNYQEYTNKTSAAHEYLDDIHRHVFLYLLAKTKQQHLKRINTTLNNLSSTIAPDIRIDLIHELGCLLLATRSYNPAKNPEYLVFECINNKLLHVPQLEFLNMLLHKKDARYPEKVIQLIMGGGKTKVLLPNIAYRKADGSNLVIVIVSEAMYETNLNDLSKVSQESFQQIPVGFVFERNHNADTNSLNDILNLLMNTIVQRNYIITTPQSLQSLELKYIEILAQQDIQNAEWHNKLKALTTILRILRSQSDVIIDEVDQNLDTKLELNYSFGTKTSVAATYPFMVADTIDLYMALNTQINLKDLLEGTTNYPTQQQFQELMQKLCQHLCHNSTSLLYRIVPSLRPTELDSMRDYLLSKCSIKPQLIHSLNLLQQDRLALLKEQLSSSLIATLSKNRNEHYGLPNTEVPGMRQRIAVPYLGANTPNIKSEFANTVALFNYTIQSNWGTVPPLTLFTLVLEDFIYKYNAFFNRSILIQYNSEKVSQHHALFKNITGLDIPLSSINLQDKQQIKNLYDQFCSQPNTHQLHTLTIHLLQQHILPAVTMHPSKLFANPQTLLSQLYTVQGMSGTIQNTTTLMPRLKLEQNFGKGTDGVTVDLLLRNTESVQQLSHKLNISDLLLTHASYTEIHSLIDLGAYCKEFSNLEVAQQLHEVFHGTEILYILYFDNYNILCALPTTPPLRTTKPIVIGTSDQDVISHILSCTPKQRFTFYDQLHITGADIAQHETAHALVTIGTSTTRRDLLQAIMRMRRLNNKQRLHFLIPPNVARLRSDLSEWSVAHILQFAIINEADLLAQQNYRAAIQKVKNVIRNYVFEKILLATDSSNALNIFNTFKNSFILLINHSFHEMYGDLAQLANTAKHLQEFGTITLLNCRNKCIEAGIFNEAELLQLADEINKIIRAATPHCYSTTYTKQNDTDSTMIQEIQVEVEVQIEKQAEIRVEIPQNAEAFEEHLWDAATDTVNTWLSSILPKLISFAKVANDCDIKPTWQFDNNLFFTDNFALTYQSQAKILDLMKTTCHIMVLQRNNNGGYQNIYIVLTPSEADYFASVINFYKVNPSLKQDCDLWIQTPYGAIYNATVTDQPVVYAPAAHQRALEQIFFMNGDVELLLSSLHNLGSNSWIATDTLSKSIFFNRHIMLNHPNKCNHYQEFVAELNKYAAVDTKPPRYTRGVP
jgi:hypothetical protein